MPLILESLINDNNSVVVTFHRYDTYSDKLSLLKIKGELQLSVVAGLIKLEGYGKYLDDEKVSARSVQSSLLYNILTKSESLNLSKDALKNFINGDVLGFIVSQGMATHCVTGIQWGAKCIVTLEYANSENKSNKDIEGLLQAKFYKMSLGIKGEANVVNSSEDEDKVHKFDIKMFGDFIPENQLPHTVDDAIQLMREMPRLAQDANGGKGKPILYTLTPIALLVEIFKLNIQQSIIIKEIDQAIAQQFVTLFDKMLHMRTNLNDVYADMEQNGACLSEDSFKEVAEARSRLSLAETSLRSDFRQLVTDVRAGKAAAENLTNALNKFNEQKIIENTQSFLRSKFVNIISEKIAFVTTLHSLGVLYVSQQKPLQTEIIKFHTKKIIIFFYSAKASERALCRENQNLFLSMIHENKTEDKDKRVFILADIDIYPELSTSEGVGDGVRICLCRNGEYINRDLLLEHKRKASQCYAKSSEVEHVQIKPNKRVILEIRCPHWYNQSGCSKENREWLCAKCNELLEYSFDGYFHCDCGRAQCTLFSFKCSDKHHGGEYVYFRNETTLKTCLSQMRTQKEVNILILGKTGVGKSTWINALANYLSFSSLKEAEKGEHIKLIPGSFTIFDSNGEQHLIETGSDPNERSSTGQSCTTEPRAYVFTCGDTLVRFIDTPGIGDTDGIEQDEKNMELTFRFISQYDELHGICILLKPNEARLDVVFRFCIKELLVRLHRTASTIICFCFTNSRSTFYQPGNTYPVLKQLLSEYKNSNVALSKHTQYCFDNEAYLYLCAVHDKVSLLERMRDDFRGSWNQSVQESQRLLKHISELEPHVIRDTTSVNHARAVIMNLAKPLDDISQNICTNIALSNDKLKESKSYKANEKEISARQKIEDFRKSLEQRIKQLQKESDMISNVGAQFVHFLRCSAIAPFNDAYAEYINFLIDKEKDKIAMGGRDDVKKQFEKMRDVYQTNLVVAFKQFNQTSTQTAHNQIDLTPEHIHQMAQSLFELPESGPTLKSLCSAPQRTQFNQTEYYFRPKSASFRQPTNKKKWFSF